MANLTGAKELSDLIGGSFKEEMEKSAKALNTLVDNTLNSISDKIANDAVEDLVKTPSDDILTCPADIRYHWYLESCERSLTKFRVNKLYFYVSAIMHGAPV